MIRLNHTALHKIKLHASQTYPEECCGLLFGKETGELKDVCEVYRIHNTMSEERHRRYRISPEQYEEAECLAEREGVRIVGLYHSHPDHPSKPSAFDLEHALPNWTYIIVSVEQGTPGEISAWVLRDDRSQFDETPISIVDGQFIHHCK